MCKQNLISNYAVGVEKHHALRRARPSGSFGSAFPDRSTIAPHHVRSLKVANPPTPGYGEDVGAVFSCIIKMIRKVRGVNFSDVIQIFRDFARRRQSFASAGTEKGRKKNFRRILEGKKILTNYLRWPKSFVRQTYHDKDPFAVTVYPYLPLPPPHTHNIGLSFSYFRCSLLLLSILFPSTIRFKREDANFDEIQL